MPRNNLPSFKLLDFSGGLNKIMSATKIKDSESPNLKNIQFTENGLPSKRQGSDYYGVEQDDRVPGLGRLYLADGSKYNLRISGGKLYYYSSGSWADVAGVAFTDDLRCSMVQANNCVYIHNGTDNMAKFDGSTLSQPSTGVIGKFGIFYGSRHVVSGNSNAPSRLYFSSTKSADDFTGLSGTATAGGASTLTDGTQAWAVNVYAGLTVFITEGTGAGQYRTISSNTATVLTVSSAWTTNPDTTSKYTIEGGDTLDVAKDDGQKVTGLGKFEEKLIIFKERSIYSLTFDSTGLPAVVQVTNAYGCVSHSTIEGVENDVFFLSNDGVRTLGYVANIPQVLRTTQLTVKIRPLIDNINSTYYEQCTAHYFNNHYLLSVPYGTSTTNNRIFAFNLLYGGWSDWTGLNANCFCIFVGADNKERLYYGSETDGYVYQLFADNYSDGASTAIEADWYSKQLDLGEPTLQKGFRFVDFQLRSLTGTLNIDIIIDGVSTVLSTPITSTFSGKDGLRVFMLREAMLREDAGSTAELVATDDARRVIINKNARTIQFRVYNSTVDESFTLMAIIGRYQTRSPYVFDSTKILY